MRNKIRRVIAKKIPYELIPPVSVQGQGMYAVLNDLLDDHHPALVQADARVVLAWALSWKADVDGRVMLGKCKRATDLDRELAPYDFVILLNREFWERPEVSAQQRRALLDHELMHAAVAYDRRGEPKRDERGRVVFRTRKHDLEEFSEIAERYGCWKKDIEQFAEALGRADRATGGWVGYSAVHEMLKRIGIDLSLEQVAMWSADERRAVMTWAILRAEADEVTGLQLETPPCVAAALEQPGA